MPATLKAGNIGIGDVLERRRRSAAMRVGAAMLLMLSNGLLLGWAICIPLTIAYLGLQAFEYIVLPRPRPGLSAAGKRQAQRLALFVMAASTLCFGAQAPLLAAKLGSWGQVCAVYVLSASVVNAVFSSVGCRPAFIALIAPCLLYLATLPLAALLYHHAPPATLAAAVGIGGLYFIFNVLQLWRTGTKSKLAELRAVHRYVAERDAHEARLLTLTHQDTLTGLPNRDVLRARLAEMAASHHPAALLMLDLDGFKYVNDTLGHGAGDEMLQVVAKRLRLAAREQDTAARLGGDEFALLLEGAVSPDAALAVAERLIAEISQPVVLDGEPINIGVSIGVALYPIHGGAAAQIFANADLALYQAKSEGRHSARLYNSGLRAQAQGKLLRDSEMRLALERGEFEVFYQPQIRLSDNKLTGAEALLRWRHPVRGLLPPAAFIASLEGGVMGAAAGAWVIETACTQAAIWRSGFAPEFRIAVNLFGMQFRSGNLVTWVEAALAKAGLPPQALEIEITENIILRHEDEVIVPLTELRDRGIGVAFDDYGTGFASLSMLTRYPVSRLKIDRAFTRAICHSPAEAAIVRAVVRLAGELGLAVTAEGVETLAQLRELRRLGCGEAQGYYFGKPMSADDFCACFGAAAPTCSLCGQPATLPCKCPAPKVISACG